MYDLRYMSQPLRNLLARLLGKFIVGIGSASTQKLERDRVNRHQPHASPVPFVFNLGNILIASGQITRTQLNETLEQQKHSAKKIGELLIVRGYARQRQVDQGLRLQHMLVSAAMGTLMALYPPVNSEAGSSNNGIKVTASIKRIARIRVLRQQSHMVISEDDITRGYLEVSAASRIEIRNSSLSGYMLTFDVQEGAFGTVYIKGLGAEVQIDSGTGWVLMPHFRGPEALELTYRFILPENAEPGTYPWPIQLHATAI